MTGVRATPAIVFVVAIAENGVIGADKGIPWRLKSDMQRFKAITMGKPIVMGRKTFETLRRPLPGRTNIVITRNAAFQAPDALVTTSFERAMLIAAGDARRRGGVDVAVIGGAEIYTQWFGLADRLEITEVHARPAGDTHFPEINLSEWEEVSRLRHPAEGEDSADFSYVTYCRRKPLKP